jgi:3-oxoacyl-[acyl-carrier protein] reductase
MDVFRLNGKVALVTGGGSGIGRATSVALAEAGAAVAIHYFSSMSGAEEVLASLRASGGRGVSIQADLKIRGEGDRVVGETVAAFGGLDILVNNAGHLVHRCPVAQMSDDLYQEIMDVNMTATFAVSRAALRYMLPRRSGSIINMSSAAAYTGGGNNATIYATSKAAIVGFTRGLAKEVGGQGIRVNAIAPGLIGTQFHDRFSTPEGRAQTVRGIPLGREGTAEDVARAVVFLASPAAAFVTGDVLAINGGMLFH